MGAEPASERRSALLIDWGGVLTTNLFKSFQEHCLRAEIDPAKLLGRFRRDPEARELLIALETGTLGEQDFEVQLARLLEVEPDGLIDGLFAGVEADRAMVAAVRTARGAGVRTAQELGMATVLHTSAETTIPELERLLDVPLSDALKASAG